MQTNFTDEQLRDPDTARSNQVLRSCVHCGMCTATCPTYQLLGDELDSPRGRIYLIKDMLENERVPDAKTVEHLDRCLSCLSCMTTCPSSVHYMHLIDHARAYVEQRYRRPLFDRLLRSMLARTLPYPARFRLMLQAARLGRPFGFLLPKRLRAMLALAPARPAPPTTIEQPRVYPAEGQRVMRAALLTGCVQPAIDSHIHEATVRLLTRHGVEVVVADGAGCCGALSHHLGRTAEARGFAARNIEAWLREADQGGLDAVAINTSGCGTVLKDYGHLMQGSPEAEGAARIGALAKDVTEILAQIGLRPSVLQREIRVAYHAACSLQHGQKITAAPKKLLKDAGFSVVEPRNPHLCCGSAGTYNLLQPEIAGQLQQRKIESLETLRPDVIAAGNIGCMTQIGAAAGTPVVHTAQLLDWATGGPKPEGLAVAKE